MLSSVNCPRKPRQTAKRSRGVSQCFVNVKPVTNGNEVIGFKCKCRVSVSPHFLNNLLPLIDRFPGKGDQTWLFTFFQVAASHPKTNADLISIDRNPLLSAPLRLLLLKPHFGAVRRQDFHLTI